jgi:hypothetical protein
MTVPLHAIQHIRRMRGGSQAHLLRASDGAYYVTKFQNSPQGVKILANEMFATSLGLWLGLPMPQTAVIEVSDWLIENTPDLRIQLGTGQVPCSSGLQFGSRYPCDQVNQPLEVFDYLPESLMAKVVQPLSFARILVLDKWLGNADGRQAIFIRKQLGRRFQPLFIDQGYCLNAEEWSFPDLPLRGVYARNCVYEQVTGWESFEPTLTKVERADVVDIWRCAERVVPEWYRHDFEGLERIVEAVHERRLSIRCLIDDFRQSSRNPFPNWHES